jgi:hypothetical protein
MGDKARHFRTGPPPRAPARAEEESIRASSERGSEVDLG